MKKLPYSDRRHRGRVDYQDFSRHFVSRLSRELRNESWGRTAFQLAWTAGPVTYLALNAGYYIGFGVAAPPRLFFYFGAYTVIMGLFAVAMRVGYNVVRGHEHERMEDALTEVMGEIPRLIAVVRNRNLETYEGDARRFLSAKYLLDNTDASEQAIRQAVHDLTGDARLADTIRSIEVFRRAGLFGRVRDLGAEVAEELARVLPAIEQRSLAVAEELRRRFAGIVPAKRQGRTRTEGFIERVLSAGEHDSHDLMSLSDVEEILTLAFELLAGRSYTWFSLQYVGQSALRDIDHRFERARRELREAIHVRNSRLRVLAEFLNESQAIHRVPSAIPVILQVREVHRNVQRAVDEIFEEIRRRAAGRNGVKGRHAPGGRAVSGLRLGAEEIDSYRTLLHLWELLQRANETVKRRAAALGRAVSEYQRLLSSSKQVPELRILAPGEPGDGVRLIPREVGLSARARMRLALRLSRVVQEANTRRRFIWTTAPDNPVTGVELTNDGYKHIAVSTAIVLDQALALGNGELQAAIEASPAANVGSIEAGLSRETRIGWGVALVRDVREDVGKAVGRLVSSLAYYHGMRISDEAVDYLTRRFNARESLLRRYAAQTTPTTPSGLSISLQRLDHQFLDIRPLPRSYHAVVDRMQRRGQESNDASSRENT